MPGTTWWQPQPAAFDWMSDTPMPSPSTAEVDGGPPVGDRGAAVDRGRPPLGAAAGWGEPRCEVGAVEGPRPVVAGHAGGFAEQVGPRRIVGVVGQIEALRCRPPPARYL